MHKKDFEDQFMSFFKFKCGALSLISLSLSLYWSHRVFLEHSSLEQRKGKARKGKERKAWKGKEKQARIKEMKVGSSSFSRNTCR